MVCAHCCVQPRTHSQTRQLMPAMLKYTFRHYQPQTTWPDPAIGLHRDGKNAEADLGADLLSPAG